MRDVSPPVTTDLAAPLVDRDRRDLARAEALVRWTDRRFVDPLVGLALPGVGDAFGAVVGLYLVALALRRGAPRVVVARMLLNLGIDALFGLVPILGDAADLVFRANSRNLALLKARTTAEGAVIARRRDLVAIGLAVLLLVAAIAAPFVLLAWGAGKLLG